MTAGTINRVLVANRGEIARRIVRGCHALGIEAVAVYSDADVSALHVVEADAAVHIGPSAPAESYLNHARLLAAAQTAGCDAVHPGYGFVSEQPEFVEACEAAGLIFIGPSAAAMRALGSKSQAKEVASRCDVATVPGWDPDSVPPDAYPVLVKASAGGGGRGMRRVDEAAALPAAVEAAAREAQAGFGDPTLLVEKLVAGARHVEVQLMCDAHGTVAAVGDRDCSLQRRHQKVIEEAPAPNLDDHLRARLHTSAERLAAEVGYVGAGTAEFLVDPASGDAYFLELNARLQVEHPVTEEAYGIDLVEWQLRIARGERLEVPATGFAPLLHSIEARLYAEDPVSMLPVGGEVVALRLPEGPGIRIDHGISAGTTIDLRYDALMGKVIATAPTREQARQLLLSALQRTDIAGVEGNQALLQHLLRLPAYVDAEHTVETLAEHPLTATDVAPDPDIADAVRTVWARASLPADSAFAAGTAPVGILVARRGDMLHYSRHGIPGAVPVMADHTAGTATADSDAGHALLAAPMPGTILRTMPEGTAVSTGEAVAVLEAMKMENRIAAPFDGVVSTVHVAEGETVAKGTPLAEVSRT